MYNLIVSGLDGVWDDAYFSLEQSRFLEHTQEAIKERFCHLDAATIAELSRLPTVFAYERDGLPARVGWITAMRLRQDEIRINFAFDEAVVPFTTEDIKAHIWEFDVNKFEMNRTHWAVKDVDLFEALIEAGLSVGFKRDPNHRLPPYATAVSGAATAIAMAEPMAAPLAVNPSIFRVPAGGVQANLVAIMMPFDISFDSVHAAIQAATSASGLECRRADNMWNDATVIQDVFMLIFQASIVVVDFTGRNPNVFYETGIAHTLGKHVVPITQNDADVPFDLRHHRYLRYLPNEQGLQELVPKLASRLATLAAR
jgi:hypothetical protein